MGDFHGFMTNKISLIKKNGERVDNIFALVQGKKILVDDISLKIKEGNKIQRVLPNGMEENYIITNIKYSISELFQGMENVTIYVQKETQIDSYSHPNQQLNIYGNNSQMNINSPNANLNTINITCTELFKKLKNVIEGKIVDENARSDLLNQVEELEKAKSEKSFSEKYTDFIASAANHATLWSAFISIHPCLHGYNTYDKMSFRGDCREG